MPKHHLRTICRPAIALILCAVPCPPAVSGQCIDYGDYLHWVGGVDLPSFGSAVSVAVAGSHAYVAGGRAGLQIVDVSRPASPTIAGGIDTPGEANGVAVSESYAYVADRSSGLHVVDVSHPVSPVIVGTADTPGEALWAAVSGSYAYLADGLGGLQIVDISNPASPAIVGRVGTPSEALCVAVSGSYAYVANKEAGLLVVDISNPSSPAIVGNVDTPGEARGVAVSGSYAYVADWLSGLHVVDVSSPASPAIVGAVETPYLASSVTVSESYAYVADGFYGGLQVVDISNAAFPAIVGSGATVGSAYGVAVSGSYAFVADGLSGLQVVDVSNPVSAPILGGTDTRDEAHGVAVAGSYAYVTTAKGFPDFRGSLQVLDVSSPASPAIVGSVDTPAEAWDVAVSGSHAYVGASYAYGYTGLLQVVDVSTPASPQTVGSVDTQGYAFGVAVSGSYAYVAVVSCNFGWGCERSTLEVVDVSDAASPEIVGSLDMPGTAHDVAVSGSYAYIAEGRFVNDTDEWGRPGLQVVDISNPAFPVALGSVETPYYAAGMALTGKYAYFGGGDSRLYTVDVSDPVSPAVVTALAVPGRIADVVLSEMHAYVATGASGLQVLDVSNPVSPILVGEVATARPSRQVAILGSYAFVAADSALQVVPAQCEESVTPSEMLAELAALVTSLDLPAGIEQSLLAKVNAAGRAVDRGNGSAAGRMLVAFVSQVDALRGRHIRGADADTLIEGAVTIMELLGTGSGPFIGPGKRQSVRDTPHDFVHTLRLSTRRSTALGHSTTIRYELPRPVPVDLAVYDVRGRRVRSLETRTATAGPHVVRWDGRDNSRLRVAAGVYFVRLVAGSETRTSKVVLLGRE